MFRAADGLIAAIHGPLRSFGNFLQSPPGAILLAMGGNVTKGKNADKAFVLVDDRQSAELLVCHVVGRFFNAVSSPNLSRRTLCLVSYDVVCALF